ncbi:MAG: hypothetical protein V3S71_08955 [Acidobacteriota bacterium]
MPAREVSRPRRRARIRPSFALLAVCWLAATVATGTLGGSQEESATAPGVPGELRQEVAASPVPGETCLVCRQPVGVGDVAVIHRGRRVLLHTDACMAAWNAGAETIFASLQPRGALFQEPSARSTPLDGVWFLLGVYILAGLVAGAVCGYVAVARGFSPLPWFFAGLAINVIALGLLLTRGRADTSKLPAGIPPGLAKVPTTRAPVPCIACGAGNHPSASRCTGCGATLLPSAESDLQRLRA